MSGDNIDEMRYLADEMGKAISTAYEQRYLADERKLEAVLKANGWRKASDVAREIFEEIDKRLDEMTVIASPNDCFITTFRKTMEKVTAEVEELKKKYTEGEG